MVKPGQEKVLSIVIFPNGVRFLFSQFKISFLVSSSANWNLCLGFSLNLLKTIFQVV